MTAKTLSANMISLFGAVFLMLSWLMLSWGCSSSDFAGAQAEKKDNSKNDAGEDAGDGEDADGPDGPDGGGSDANDSDGGNDSGDGDSGDSDGGDGTKSKGETDSGLEGGEDGLDFDEDAQECNRSVEGGYAGKVYQLQPDIQKLPDFTNLTPVGEVESPQLDVPDRAWTSGFPGVDGLVEWFAIVFEAELKVTEETRYSFKTNSDDGSRLFIDGNLVVDNDGQHAPKAKESAPFTLDDGPHKIKVEWFQGPRTQIALQVYWKKEGGPYEIIPAEVLKFKKDCDLKDLGTFE